MLAADANREGLMGVSITQKSQIANVLASAEFRNSWNDCDPIISHNANMIDEEDKNGGENHLGAWMRYRKVNGAQLASELGKTPGMISDLVNSKRALSAKWLRRLAPALKTTPGMLLDHDPFTLDADMIDIWVTASLDQRKTLADIARAVVKSSVVSDKNGTHG